MHKFVFVYRLPMNLGNRHLGRDDSLSRPKAMVKLTALRPARRASPTPPWLGNLRFMSLIHLQNQGVAIRLKTNAQHSSWNAKRRRTEASSIRYSMFGVGCSMLAAQKVSCSLNSSKWNETLSMNPARGLQSASSSDRRSNVKPHPSAEAG